MQTGDLPGPLILCKMFACGAFPLTAARRWRRPRTTLAPERFARFQRLSLALSYLVLARRPALTLVSYSGLWFSLFPW